MSLFCLKSQGIRALCTGACRQIVLLKQVTDVNILLSCHFIIHQQGTKSQQHHKRCKSTLKLKPGVYEEGIYTGVYRSHLLSFKHKLGDYHQ